MRNIIFIVLLVFLIQGCSSVGMFTANHNGKKYWDPGNCSKYQYYYSDMDKIYCLEDGVRTGVVLEPMTNEQVIQVQQSRRSSSESMNRGLQNLNNSLNQTNQQAQQMLNSNSNTESFDLSKQKKKYYYMQQTAPNLYYIK